MSFILNDEQSHLHLEKTVFATEIHCCIEKLPPLRTDFQKNFFCTLKVTNDSHPIQVITVLK